MPAESGMTSPVLEVDHLTVRFEGAQGSLDAVDDVSFAIAPGETLGLVGESGSGKTTVGRALLGLNRPSAGILRLDGQDIAALQQSERAALPRRIQMVFQDPYGSLNPRFSVERTLAEVLAFHAIVPRAEIGREVRRLMGLVGLSVSLAERLPRHLSGGQR